MSVADVKTKLEDQAKVPVEEQRLFYRGQELRNSSQVSPEAVPEIMLVRSASDPRETNLRELRSSATFQSLCSSNFTLLHRLKAGINGEVFKYQWSRNERTTSVAVKKLRNTALEELQHHETDEWYVHFGPKRRHQSKEDALVEIGVLTHLSNQPDLPLYLLRSLAVFTESSFTWLITEYCDGGELFELAAAGGLTETRVRDYTWQMLQASTYLHRHGIGHRDISLENVLLKDGIVRLMDYGMAVCSHSSSGTPLRYFCEVGKPFYRAPECYVPKSAEVEVTMPASAKAGDVVMMHVMMHGPPGILCEVRAPESKPGSKCLADVWGYAATPADVWALGVCVFILAFQCPPWERAQLSNRLFARAYNSGGNGVVSLLTLWKKQEALSKEAIHLLSDMLQTDPVRRPSSASCLSHTWFSALSNRRIELHSDSQQIVA
jgi:serine/threonine protein kinase